MNKFIFIKIGFIIRNILFFELLIISKDFFLENFFWVGWMGFRLEWFENFDKVDYDEIIPRVIGEIRERKHDELIEVDKR